MAPDIQKIIDHGDEAHGPEHSVNRPIFDLENLRQIESEIAVHLEKMPDEPESRTIDVKSKLDSVIYKVTVSTLPRSQSKADL